MLTHVSRIMWQASCTLEAGVKIYSTRVDSVHSETYKVLGGLNRTAGDDNGNGEYRLFKPPTISSATHVSAYAIMRMLNTT